MTDEEEAAAFVVEERKAMKEPLYARNDEDVVMNLLNVKVKFE